jgi:DNA-binding transcriptional LysR family regulator
MPRPTLAALDLNLLLVFDAVAREQHVTRAAHNLGMSQPAVSAALGKLRHFFADELFVKVPGGVRPTARGSELQTPVRHAIAELEAVISPVTFDPGTAKATFTIAMEDYAKAVLLPPLAGRLAREAPGVRVIARAGGHDVSPRLLDAAEADFAVGTFADPPDRFAWQELFDDEHVAVLRSDHPALESGALTLEAFASARHLLVSLSGPPRGFVDRLLEARGLERRIAMVVDSFLAAPAVLAGSDMIATLPRRLAENYAPDLGLALVAPPLTMPRAKLRLLWTRRTGRHPARDWMAYTLTELSAAPPSQARA